jgi:hypothetical protein
MLDQENQERVQYSKSGRSGTANSNKNAGRTFAPLHF